MDKVIYITDKTDRKTLNLLRFVIRRMLIDMDHMNHAKEMDTSTILRNVMDTLGVGTLEKSNINFLNDNFSELKPVIDCFIPNIYEASNVLSGMLFNLKQENFKIS